MSDIEHGWIMCSPEKREQLNELQAKGNKREVSIFRSQFLLSADKSLQSACTFACVFQYIEVSRNLPCYGCIKFSNAIVDYPKPNEVASVLVGNKELSIQTINSDMDIQETNFKVTRMRCWRVTTNYNVNKNIASFIDSDNDFHLFSLHIHYFRTRKSHQTHQRTVVTVVQVVIPAITIQWNYRLSIWCLRTHYNGWQLAVSKPCWCQYVSKA